MLLGLNRKSLEKNTDGIEICSFENKKTNILESANFVLLESQKSLSLNKSIITKLQSGDLESVNTELLPLSIQDDISVLDAVQTIEFLNREISHEVKNLENTIIQYDRIIKMSNLLSDFRKSIKENNPSISKKESERLLVKKVRNQKEFTRLLEFLEIEKTISLEIVSIYKVLVRIEGSEVVTRVYTALDFKVDDYTPYQLIGLYSKELKGNKKIKIDLSEIKDGNTENLLIKDKKHFKMLEKVVDSVTEAKEGGLSLKEIKSHQQENINNQLGNNVRFINYQLVD